MKPAIAFLLGALATGALGMAGATRNDSPLTVSRVFATTHLGDTVSDFYTVSTDSVSIVLPRPPGFASRVALMRCGNTVHYSRKRIGARVIAAESLFIVNTATASECANPPPIIPCTHTDSAKFVNSGANADTTTDPALTDVRCS